MNAFNIIFYIISGLMAAFWYTTMFYRQIGMIRYIFAFALFSLTNWGLTLINCLLIWQWLGIIIFLAYMVIAVHVLPRFTTDIVFRRFLGMSPDISLGIFGILFWVHVIFTIIHIIVRIIN